MMIKLLFVCFYFVSNLNCYSTKNRILEDQNYWKTLGHEDILESLNVVKNDGIAKNVILFVADGMGVTTSTAARIYGKTEKGYLAFDRFPDVGVLKTYSANKLVPDSCSTATALFCGVKVNQKTSGVDATVAHGDCEASLNVKAQLDSIIKWAQQAGKSTGIVTTTRVTHATPSALYAHTADRNWECEAVMPKSAKQCKDIARQLVEDEPGKNIQVIMGGGRQCLQSNVSNSERDPIDTWSCYSQDGRDLINDWIRDKSKRNLKHSVVYNNDDLEDLDTDVDYVLGIFANGHLKMDFDRDTGPHGMPSLTQMTEKALQVLQKNDKGFLLMVEGGMIDFAHHRGHAKQALDEVVAFSDAIDRSVELTELEMEETLIIVTSDHSHSLVFSGYADRGTSITGIAQPSKIDAINYTSLLYGTGGPDNFQFKVVDNQVKRPDPSEQDVEDFNYFQQAVVLTDEETHGGADVLVYAKGPKSFLFHSIHEQTYIAYAVAYSAKIGPYNNASHIWSSTFVLTFICVLILNI